MLTALRVLANPSDKSSNPLPVLSRKTQYTPLYCLVASTLIGYYKAMVIWQWGHDHVMKYNAYNAYDKQNRRWNGGDPSYKLNHSQPISPLEPTEQPPGEPDWNDFSQPEPPGLDGKPVRQLKPAPAMLQIIDEILLHAEGDGTDDNPGLYTTMMKNWYTDRQQKITDRVSNISLCSDGTRHWYRDSGSSHTDDSPYVRSQALAEIHMESKCGALIAYLWGHWTTAYGLDGVKEEDLKAFGDCVPLWKQARAAVNFKVHKVMKGDTLTSIAQKTKFMGVDGKKAPWYSSPLYNRAIFDANYNQALNKQTLDAPAGVGTDWSPDWATATLIEGQLLTLPDPSTARFTIYTMSATDDIETLVDRVPHDTTGSSIHVAGQRAMATLIFAGWNRDVAGPYTAGTTVRIPTIEALKIVSSTAVDPHYAVVKGDTLSSITKSLHWYPSPLYNRAIFDTNYNHALNKNALQAPAGVGTDWSAAWATAPLIEGQVLTLPAPEAARFVLYTMKPGEDFGIKLQDLTDEIPVSSISAYLTSVQNLNQDLTLDPVHILPGDSFRLPKPK